MSGSPNWIRAIAVVLAAVSSAACVTTAGYSGIGVLNVSGEPAILTPVSVKLAWCVRSAPAGASSESPSSWGGPGADSLAYAVLSIGPGCRIEGTSGVEFRPITGGTCAIDFAEGRRKLRVTSTLIRLPRYMESAEVEVGGEDLASGKYVLFRFTGSRIDPDPDPAACTQDSAAHATNSGAHATNSAAR